MSTEKQTALELYSNQKRFMQAGATVISDVGYKFPKDYDAEGAISSLYMEMKKINAFNGKYTATSIDKAMKTMLANSWNPSKGQCYLVPYGNEITVQASYFGNQRTVYDANPNVVRDSIHALPIYSCDEFEDKVYPDGRVEVIKHERPKNFKDRIGAELIGAYAVIRIRDGRKIVIDTEIMDINSIKRSWAMSRSGGATHEKFGEEMAKKTVINRLCKRYMRATTEETRLYDTTSAPAEVDYVDESDYSDTINNETVVDVVEDEHEIKEAVENTPFEITVEEYSDNMNDYEIVENSYNEESGTVLVKKKTV